jgi:hypothetical protein
MTDPRVAFVCSRLNLRNGKRRLHHGYSAAGIAALYDSLLFGMQYYIATHKRCAILVKDTDLWDPARLFQALTRAGVFDDALTFNRFCLVVERALWQKSFSFDVNSTIVEVEKLLTKLGVMPFDAFTLPGVPRSAH